MSNIRYFHLEQVSSEGMEPQGQWGVLVTTEWGVVFIYQGYKWVERRKHD